MVNFPHIRSFLEIAECLNFTEAAARLYTTQSSLSKTIAKFEVELGFKLFERSNREVTLTREGQYLYEQVRGSVEEMDNSIVRARRISRGVEGSFQLGLAGAVGFNEELCGLLRGFSDFSPHFDFELITMNFKEMREDIISGAVDAVITKSYEAGHIGDCDTYALFQYPPVIVVRRGHPVLERTECPTLRDFRECGFVAISPSFSPKMHSMLYEYCQAEDFIPDVIRQTRTIYDLLIHVAASDYAAVLDASDVPAGEGLHRVIPIRNMPAVGRTLFWKKENKNPALQAFLTYVKERN